MTDSSLPPAARKEPVLTLKQAVFTVLEGFTLHQDARKILEAAYYTPPAKPQDYKLPYGDDDFVKRMGVLCLSCGEPYGRHFGDTCPNETTSFIAKEAE